MMEIQQILFILNFNYDEEKFLTQILTHYKKF
jgi:hypothetical protein